MKKPAGEGGLGVAEVESQIDYPAICFMRIKATSFW